MNFRELWKHYGVVAILAAYALVAVFCMPRCTKLNALEAAAREAPVQATAELKTTPTPKPTATPKPKEPELITGTLAYAGDLVCHMGINEQAWNGTDYDYVPIMEGAAPYIQEADLAFCTLETTFPDDGDISGYPCFHSPRALAQSLKDVGFDLIEMASNHCLDAHKEGLDSTLDVLDAVGLHHVGTYRSQEERDQNSGIVVEDVNGISVAFIDYTYGTNGFPVSDYPYATNIFFDDYMEIDCADIDELNLTKIDADIEAAKAMNPDVIAVCMHWGLEYHTEPVDYQYTVADHLFQQGVDLILGGHPHVPEPMEIRTVTDKDGNEKTGYLCYCMGNFLSCMNDRYTNLTGVTTIQLEKDVANGKTYLKNVSYAPLIMVDTADHGIYNGWRYKLVDLHKAIDSYWSGDSLGYINEQLYNDMLVALDDLHSIFGIQFDRFDPNYTPNEKGEMPVPAAAPTTDTTSQG